MSDTAKRLKDFLLADTAIAAVVGSHVHQELVPEGSEDNWIWFSRSLTENEICLDAAPGTPPLSETFDVEAISPSLATAQELALLVWNRCNCYRGTFGSGTVKGVFVNSQSDDYVPRGVYADSGLHVSALSVQIFP